MSTRFGNAVRFGCRNYFKGAAVFGGAMLAVYAAFSGAIPFFPAGGRSVTFNGWGFASVFFLLVLGIVGLRENLRMFVQNGVSRRSAFLAELTAIAAVSAALAVYGQVLTGVVQLLSGGRETVFVADLYQLVYVGYAPGGVMTPGQLAVGGLLNLSLLLALGMLGEFFSALFWRLNKFWTVVAAIAIPVLLNGAAWGLYWLADRMPALMEAVGAMARWLLASPWNLMAASLLAAAALAGINWLLLRRAHIKAAK